MTTRSVTEILPITACPVQHDRTSHQTWEIGLKPTSNGVVVGDPVEDNRSVDDAVQAGNQDGNEGRQRAQKERGRRGLRNDMRQLAD